VRFRPARSRGGAIGLAALGVTAAFEAVLVYVIATGPIGPRTAILLVLALLVLPVIARLLYWVFGYYRLAYEVTRDGLIVHWATMRQVIPMQDITRIASDKQFLGGFEGIHWPGYQIGQTRVRSDDDRIVETLVYATAPPEEQLVVFTTANVAYAVSPDDRAAFVEEFKVRRRLGPVQRLNQETVQPALLRRAVWSDRPLLRLLAVAVCLNAMLFAAAAWWYPSLPPNIPLQYRFDPELARSVALPDRGRDIIWTLPGVGLAALGLNAALAFAVHERARVAAMLLVIGAVALHLIIGVALIRVP
jgi:hypothetical protein